MSLSHKLLAERLRYRSIAQFLSSPYDQQFGGQKIVRPSLIGSVHRGNVRFAWKADFQSGLKASMLNGTHWLRLPASLSAAHFE